MCLSNFFYTGLYLGGRFVWYWDRGTWFLPFSSVLATPEEEGPLQYETVSSPHDDSDVSLHYA